MISAMLDYRLSPEILAELRRAHRRTRDKREAYRINAVLLLGGGWTAEQVAEALLIDPNSVRNHFKSYRDGGLKALGDEGYCGSECLLGIEQLAHLELHLKAKLYPTAKAVAAWVEESFGVSYTPSGMTALLHRLGFVYKRSRLVPGKADPQAQREFLADYQKLKETHPDAPIYFMDAVHPQHNPLVGCGWIKRGEDQSIPSNSGRRRLNINGAIELKGLTPLVRFDERIDAQSSLALFRQIEQSNPLASSIPVICDNARYYRSRAVAEYLKTSPIKLVFLPPYAPNLNLIERLWKFFKKTVLYNRYYERFSQFQEACTDFFNDSRKYHSQLRSLLTENFAIVGE
jgi:transposase